MHLYSIVAFFILAHTVCALPTSVASRNSNFPEQTPESGSSVLGRRTGDDYQPPPQGYHQGENTQTANGGELRKNELGRVQGPVIKSWFGSLQQRPKKPSEKWFKLSPGLREKHAAWYNYRINGIPVARGSHNGHK
ncbi:hypothetical protein F5887DRAFT_169758 [Amanita rubescens]|nr:hypothetical protein F5887DRAFT_169758 [Amanita rubescens]